jgi:protein-tyrosine phosphatase
MVTLGDTRFWRLRGRGSMTEVLVLCTANVCRSPMAAALLTDRLRERQAGARVRSAGSLTDGQPADPAAIRTLAARRLDISGHRSRLVRAGDLASADLILAMDRSCLRHAVVLAPAVWPRAFTLKELIRRGRAARNRAPAESLRDWLDRMHQGRARADLLGGNPDDDVADPAGGPQRGYDRTAAVLSSLLDELVAICWPEMISSV